MEIIYKPKCIVNQHNLTHIITVHGNSMKPIITNGDKIVTREINNLNDFYFGQIYLVVTENYRMLRYVRKHKDDNFIILKSANETYDDIELPKAEIIKLFIVESVLSIKNMM
ncbi:MAG: S24 family peptidase [Rikenellaceae bacterium]